MSQDAAKRRDDAALTTGGLHKGMALGASNPPDLLAFSEPISPETASATVNRRAAGPAPRVGNRRNVLVVCGLLLLAVIAVFGQTARHGFVNLDDDVYVYENRHVRAGLTGGGIVWAFSESHVSSPAYLGYARRPYSLLRYLTVTVLFALGLMAKPMLVTLPFVLLLLDYWPLGRIFCVRLVVEKIPLFVLAAASAAVTFLAQRSGGTVVSLASVPISARLARAALLYVTYLGKTLWPLNLAAAYPAAPMERAWAALGAGALLAMLTAGALWGAWCGQRWLAAGWFWYLGTLLPTIGLIQVGMQVMADRFLYLPQIGICVAVAWGAGLAGSWRYRRWVLAAAAALVVTVSIVSA